MATFKFGNGDNLLVNVNTNGDTYIAGNGNNDTGTPTPATMT